MNGLGVIFDMDGVLVDSYRPHLLSWQQAARERGLDLTEAQFATAFGRTSRDIIARLWPGRFADDQVAAFDARKEQAYRDIIAHDFPEMEGAGALVEARGIEYVPEAERWGTPSKLAGPVVRHLFRGLPPAGPAL